MDMQEEMYKRRIAEMEGRISNLERMLKLIQVINSTLEINTLLDIIVQVATELTVTESASIMLMDAETGELRFAAVTGQKSAEIKPLVVPLEGSIAGAIALHNEPMLIRNVKDDPRWYQNTDEKSGFVTRSIIGVPMQARGRVIGVLEALNKKGDAEMSWDDVEILTSLANQAAIAIQNARLLSELKEAYDRLSQLDQMKSNFISIAAHELRTPLSLILGYAMFLRASASGEAEEQINIVLQGAMRLRTLIDDMINLREVDSGDVGLDLEEFLLQSWMETVAEEMRPLIEGKAQQFSLSLPAEPITVQADRQKLSIAVDNLLSNAIKFTERGKRIGIQARVDEDVHQVLITVWDTGIGIPKKEFNRIFDRFYQIEPSLSRHYEGMGLGLSIAQAMVEMHHGRIKVQSEEGKGSAFTLCIPLRQTINGQM